MTYRLSEVCARTGVSGRQLREWERRGIVAPARGSGNQRVYGEDDIPTLQRAKRLRDAGFSLADTKAALSVLSGRGLDGELDGLRQVRGLLQRINAQLSLAEELTEAVRARLARQHGVAPYAKLRTAAK